MGNSQPMLPNRSNTPLPKSVLTPCSSEGILPSISVDKLRARIFTAHTKLVAGRHDQEAASHSNFTLPYKVFILPNGKVKMRSVDWASVFLEYNPAQLEFGQNVSLFSYDLTETVKHIFNEILPGNPELSLSRKDSLLLRAGLADLSEISLAADFRFPSRQALKKVFLNLDRSWNWRLNRRKNMRYLTTTYWNQTDWILKAYFKEEEIEANHPDWPSWTRERSRNVLRIELRIRRQDIRKLGARLHCWIPELPCLDFSTLFHWEPWLYPLVFDLYAARLQSIHRKHSDPTKDRFALYRFLAKYGGEPVTPRDPKDEILPEFYRGRGPGGLVPRHMLRAQTDPHADDHLDSEQLEAAMWE